ncbi:hypothetical protein NQ314_005396 [Rhamnusium bicolor]|uniref:leucine--tRNA ligase n=1 Tax=Rhamnusium bicolor TaxID=1586634 RepID=A0AAV8ZJA1_9CUCU|nr:hypothetical protein NQ314_005396 [Rhamnusium bicolor]
MIFKHKTITIFKNIYNRHLCISRHCSSGLNLWDEEISTEIKQKIENHWRDKIRLDNFIETDTSKEKYYVLSMFPYPSGFLHMGHVRVYTISDAVARYQRMNGKNVLFPMGWDAFGLPAENAAIERQTEPQEWTKHNILHMKKQLQQLGCSFDWDRELTTCDPKYYRWTQDLFLKLHYAGLIYQKEALVNWDPIDQTVLAEEQVDENGCSWRSGAKVEKKLLKQWFVRTTKFAKDLLDGLDDSVLQDWRDIIKLQKHWIGECNGVNFDFKLTDSDSDEFLTLWTSKPEYIEHVKFVAVNVNHTLARREGIKSGERTVKLSVELENPFNKEKIPVYVTSDIEFLPMTDSYVGIPVVLEQATDFARTHNIPYSSVPIIEPEQEIKHRQQEVCNKAKQLNIGGYWTSAKLRDWLISRQRYWGTPIPIVHCEKCGAQPVPKESLPVELPILSKVSEKRYLDPNNINEMFDKEKARMMTPVDLYIGGKEHAVLHLYYARFISHFLHSLGLLPEREPFKRLLVQGMVMGRSYRIKGTGEYLPENKINILDLKRNKAVVKDTGEPVVIAWEKMSKSKYNGVDPDDMFRNFGTDTTRLLILADVAPTSHRNWNSNTFPGILNWQKRLWLTIRDFLNHRNNLPPMISEDQFRSHDDYMFDSRNYYIKGTSFNYLIAQQLSVAISKQQGLTNSIRIILIAPMAPYFASELWSGFVSAPNRLNDSEEILWDKSVFEQKWPQTDMNYNLDLVCQVNGYENCVVKIARSDIEKLSKQEAIKIALKQKKVQNILTTRNILDAVYTIHTGCEGIINILTDQPPAKVKVQQAEN